MTAGIYGNHRGRNTRVHQLVVPMALPRRRLVAMLVSTMLIATCLTVRLVTLQVTPPGRLIEFSESRASRIIDLVAPRGAIVDHYNRDLVLTTQAKTVAVDPMLVPDIPTAAFKLASIFSTAVSDLEQRLIEARDGNKHFAYIARQVTEAQAAEAMGLGIEGLFTIDEPKRIKPSGPLVGASVLGSTDIDNNGQSGVEKQFDAILSGKKGKLIIEEGTKGRTIPGGVRTGVSAESGSTLVLALDRVLQFEVDQLLAQAVDRWGAKYGVAIVSRVGTSEILANSVVHRVDGKPAEPITENRAVTWGFEPGSVMKALTISALIDSGTVDVDSEFVVPFKLDVHDVTYSDDHYHNTERMTAERIIKESSNVGTIMMTQQLGESALHGYLTNFGLGAPSGLGFPGEHAGYVGNYGRWDGTTLPSYAIGQSVIATPMQMLMAMNTIANDGLYVAPRYALGRQTGDGKFIPEPASEERRVISPESAAKVNQILQTVVAGGGTGTSAQVSGYTVAGKTGTAWKAQNPHWIDDHYRDASGLRHLSSSFMGFLPAEDPQLSIIVILDDVTDTNLSGGKIAAPVFSAIGDFATRLLNIAPTAEAATSPVRVKAKPELPPPPPTLESATTTVPATTVPATTAPTTTTKPTATTKATAPTTRAPTTSPPTTTRIPTARAPTAASSG